MGFHRVGRSGNCLNQLGGLEALLRVEVVAKVVQHGLPVHLVDEFLVLARTTDVPIPTIERLYPHLGADAPLLPDGSAEIPLDWRSLWMGLGAVVAVVVGLVLVLSRLL